jgi:3-hydroxyisobutyrate dehydrogenase-like beta-hydroxyacid dehydrogenase
MRERVGFIGLGRMGAPMAANVARAGFPLAVHNRTPAAMRAFVAEHGAAAADDPASLADSVDVVVTMLADDAALGEVMTGPRGVLAGLRQGSLVIDMGTVGRRAILELGAAIAAAGSELVDAPVSGVPKVASEGRLTIMAGASPAALERARPVLEAIGERIIHVGPPGTGAAMKLAINTAIHGFNQAVSEALVLAERAGIERATAYEVFVAGAISGPFVVNRRRVFEHPGEGPQPFALDLAAKDVRLALELADEVGALLEQAALNLDVLQRASRAGLGQLDESAVAIYLRGRTDGSLERRAGSPSEGRAPASLEGRA